jgi:hypothetical protein
MITTKFGPSNYSYSTLCSFDNLTINNPMTLQCLTLPASLLVTQTTASFTLLTPIETMIDKDYKSLIDKLGIKIFRFKNIPIPKAGVDFHVNQKREGWITSYQRFAYFQLVEYKKIVY